MAASFGMFCRYILREKPIVVLFQMLVLKSCANNYLFPESLAIDSLTCEPNYWLMPRSPSSFLVLRVSTPGTRQRPP